MTKYTGATLALISTALLLTISPVSAQSPACPDNPDALGTSRVLSADPRTFPMVGSCPIPGVASPQQAGSRSDVR